MTFKKIDHINIVVQDLEAAKNFFLDLGFTVFKEGDLEGEWINKVVKLSGVKARFIALSLPDSQTNLELIQYYAPSGSTDPLISMPNQVGFRHMAIEVKGIEKIVATLKEKGVVFFSEIQTYNITKKLCYFLGPEGIILELAEYQ